MTNYYIYSITDPTTDKVIYVGQTQNPVERFRGHMYNKVSPVGIRLQELKKLNKIPVFTIIENVDYLDVSKREKYWISYYRKLGNDLLNFERRKVKTSYIVNVNNGVKLDFETQNFYE